MFGLADNLILTVFNRQSICLPEPIINFHLVATEYLKLNYFINEQSKNKIIEKKTES